jgi:endonuclease/exonuclease/phosphatase family metal-dependent hydrolase
VTRLRVVTWNVHEGLRADGELPDSSASFWAELVAAEVDIAALQEVRFSAAGELGDLALAAESGGMPHIAAFPLSASSFWAGDLAGLALLSRHPFRDEQRKKLPNPGLSNEHDESVLTSHDKGLLSAVLHHNGRSVRVISLHAPPFHRFGRVPREFTSIWAELGKSIGPLDDLPLLVGGDFNTDDRELLTEQVDGRLRRAIGCQDTHGGKSTDDILYTDALDLVGSKVIGTQSDHALCLAEFELSPSLRDHAVMDAAITGVRDAREHPPGHRMA